MTSYTYDLHMHSCLSPCAEDDMTPNNMAGMAALAGIQVLALTDHNTTKNCPAFFAACKRQGVIPIAGMELTTAEDIHIICLFETLDKAMVFGEEIDKRRVPIKNRPNIFGNQLIVDQNDQVIGTEENLLINATTLGLEQAVSVARSFGAVVYPAHIDRQGNGIIATLGVLPDTPHFDVVEFHGIENIARYENEYPNIIGKRQLVCSDSHYLADIPDGRHTLEIEDTPYSSALVRKNILTLLKESKT